MSQWKIDGEMVDALFGQIEGRPILIELRVRKSSGERRLVTFLRETMP